MARISRTSDLARKVSSGCSEAEFAVLVHHDYVGLGLGRYLMQQLLARAVQRGVAKVQGFVLRENAAMLALAQQLGFVAAPDPDDPGCVRVSIDPLIRVS